MGDTGDEFHLVFKLEAAASMIAVAVVGGFLPLRFRISAKVMARLSTFAGGVFFAVGLVHMLPDSMKSAAALEEKLGGLPIAMYCAGLGFFLTLFVEKVALGQAHSLIFSAPDDCPHHEPLGVNHATGEHEHANENTPLITPSNEHSHAHGNGIFQSRPQIIPDDSALNRDGLDTFSQASLPVDVVINECGASKYENHDRNRDAITGASSSSATTPEHPHAHRISYYDKLFGQGVEAGLALTNHLRGEEIPIARNREEGFNIVPYLLLAVLSLHSVIAGLTVGMINDKRQVALILVGILAHKGTAALALSISMLCNRVPKGRIAKLVVAFSFATPCGILTGLLLDKYAGGDHESVTALLEALGSGTFLYVSCIDILGNEFGAGTDRWAKFAMAFTGFCLMGALESIG